MEKWRNILVAAAGGYLINLLSDWTSSDIEKHLPGAGRTVWDVREFVILGSILSIWIFLGWLERKRPRPLSKPSDLRSLTSQIEQSARTNEAEVQGRHGNAALAADLEEQRGLLRDHFTELEKIIGPRPQGSGMADKSMPSEFFLDRDDLGYRLEQELKDCESMWAVWFTGIHAVTRQLFDDGKPMPLRHLILVDPEGDAIKGLVRPTGSDLEVLTLQIRETSRQALHRNVQVWWYDGPITPLVIGNPDTVGQAWVRLEAPLYFTAHRPGFKLTETHNPKFLEWAKLDFDSMVHKSRFITAEVLAAPIATTKAARVARELIAKTDVASFKTYNYGWLLLGMFKSLMGGLVADDFLRVTHPLIGGLLMMNDVFEVYLKAEVVDVPFSQWVDNQHKVIYQITKLGIDVVRELETLDPPAPETFAFR